MTSLDIANTALTKLGEPVILGFTDGTKASDVMKVRYPACRDLLLRNHTWTFAKVVTGELSPLTGDVPEPWTYAFQVPSDCSRILNVGPVCEDIPYELVDTRILTYDNPIVLRYVRNYSGYDDSANFPADFAETLACYLAADVARLVTQDAAAGDRLLQNYSDNIRIARFNGAIEKYPTAIEASEWVNAHGGYYLDIGSRSLAT